MSTKQKGVVVDSQFLPESKELQFQTVVKAFENEQWAKGLKLVEPLLKEFPENGKLISMKSILKFNIDKNVEEAEAGLKKGMMLGRRTSLCWHLYGIFQRSQKKYMEAKKSFQLAYSLNPLNLQILVDLSSLQVQVRDYAGYRVSKQKLMNERSGNQNYWMGFIMGAYLDKKYELCIDIISSFFPSLEQKPSYQMQELLFLQADCYYQLKKWDEAIDVITKGMKWILDEDKANETLATYYLMKEDYSTCHSLLQSLFHSNCDNRFYAILYECELLKRPDFVHSQNLPSFTYSLSNEEKHQLLQAYKELFTHYPKSIYLPLVLLNLMEEEECCIFLKQQVYKAIRKGIPSFFHSLLPLFQHTPEKLNLLKKLCLEAYEQLKTTHYLEEGIEEEPFTFLWCVLLLAEIEDYEHHFEKALQYVNEGIEHTPTCCDAYRLKSKIYKHAGYLKQSEEQMEKGYEIDKFDRFMNTKCVKSCLLACHIEKADEIASYWTRVNVPLRIDFETVEACWYELRCARASYRLKDYPHAFKLFSTVLNHFDTFVTEQFDFHEYVLRKSDLLTYAHFLHTIDHVYQHPYFIEAAIGALQCAITIFDHPFNETEYCQHFTLTKPMVHKKGAEFKDDKDPDGLKLIQDKKMYENLLPTVTQLLQSAKNHRKVMVLIVEWAKRINKKQICEEAIENLKTCCNASFDVAYCSKLIDSSFEMNLNDDLSSIHNRNVMAKIELLENPSHSVFDILTKQWEFVKRDDLEEFIEGYQLLCRNDQAKLQEYVHLVESIYPGFEEAVECWVH